MKKTRWTYDPILTALFSCYLLFIIGMSILVFLPENRHPSHYSDRNIMGVIR
jgi:hypothetical protein